MTPEQLRKRDLEKLKGAENTVKVAELHLKWAREELEKIDSRFTSALDRRQMHRALNKWWEDNEEILG